MRTNSRVQGFYITLLHNLRTPFSDFGRIQTAAVFLPLPQNLQWSLFPNMIVMLILPCWEKVLRTQLESFFFSVYDLKRFLYCLQGFMRVEILLQICLDTLIHYIKSFSDLKIVYFSCLILKERLKTTFQEVIVCS